jgi:hypothetical protein
MQLRADPELRGRVLALQTIVFLGSTPIGGPIVGALCEIFSPRVGVLVGALAALAAATYGHLASRALGRPAPAPGLDGDVTALPAG